MVHSQDHENLKSVVKADVTAEGRESKGLRTVHANTKWGQNVMTLPWPFHPPIFKSYFQIFGLG